MNLIPDNTGSRRARERMNEKFRARPHTPAQRRRAERMERRRSGIRATIVSLVPSAFPDTETLFRIHAGVIDESTQTFVPFNTIAEYLRAKNDAQKHDKDLDEFLSDL